MNSIGIITVHHAYNYGAVLQVYALQTFLLNHGYDCYIINYRNKIIENDYKFLNWHSKNLKKVFKNILKALSMYKLDQYIIRKKNYETFFKKYYHLSPLFKTESDLKQNFPKYDFYIAGSDQIWNPEITCGLSDIYTLNFGSSKTYRISYAASTGLGKIDKEYYNCFRDKLQIINKISIREKDNKNLLEKLTGKKIDVVLDPTMLLSNNFWCDKISTYPLISEKYILSYIVGEKNDLCQKIVNLVSEETGLKVVYCEKKNNYDRPLKSIFSEDPFCFLNYLKNAEYVITTSFHGVVFSIIFEKKFLAIQNIKNNSRVLNLLKMLQIENRVILKEEDYKSKMISENIDYASVNESLNKYRKISQKFVLDALNKKE